MPGGKLLGVERLVREETGESRLVWVGGVFQEGFPGEISFDQRVEGFN